MPSNKNSNVKLIAAVVVVAIVVLALYFLFVAQVAPVSAAAGAVGVYNHATGNLTVAVSQNTGSSWAIASVLFVPSGAGYSNGVPVVNWTNSTALPNGFPSGKGFPVTLHVSGPVAVGTPLSGTIWSAWQFNAGGTIYYTQVGTVNTTAT